MAISPKLSQRERWGMAQDKTFFGLWKVFPSDHPHSLRNFYFFEPQDAERFIALLDKSVHEVINEAK